jgi:hypothetical protein
MLDRNLIWAGLLCVELGLLGCSSARDVEVSGKVMAASSVAVVDEVVIDFIDLVGDGADAPRSVVRTTKLKTLGDYRETLALEGDRVLIRAVADDNGDGVCSEGEAWGEVQARVDQDKVEAESLVLSTKACPREE